MLLDNQKTNFLADLIDAGADRVLLMFGAVQERGEINNGNRRHA